MCVYMYMHTHVYTQVYVHVYAHVYMCECECVYVFMKPGIPYHSKLHSKVLFHPYLQGRPLFRITYHLQSRVLWNKVCCVSLQYYVLMPILNQEPLAWGCPFLLCSFIAGEPKFVLWLCSYAWLIRLISF
jgi:hypothetical protein